MPFTLKSTRHLTDIDSIGYIYEHNKTKATVMYIENNDDNKVFSISFATPPENNNGIAHILEHSVLCGSRKYPTKEPFVELAKGSLNTFLNAFTSADRTTYPVASKNQKDFNHLMDVYLDAVFYPNLLDNPFILAQEGWHYHLENIDDDLIYKGVVYNEMKGAYSDSNTVMYHHAKKALFPDTIYAHESGGHPLDIPTLTQDDFIAFHQNYYHPSNAFTFLYGDLNITEQLERLDVYFEEFNYRQIDNGITLQKPFTQRKDIVIPYSISEDESTDYKTFLSLEFVIGPSSNMRDYVHYSVLNDVLLGSNAAPLWKALIEANIASDIDGGYNNSMAQATFDITLSNSELEHKETFIQIVFDTLRGLVANGIDQTLVQAAINKNKFALKEATMQSSFPKGVAFAMSASSQWLVKADLFNTFFVEDILNDLEKHPEYLIDCIQKGFLNNNHAIFLAGVPETALNDKLFQDVHEQLQQYKASLSSEQLEQLVMTTHHLMNQQNEPDRPEALATIPMLTLDDLKAEVSVENAQVTTEDAVTYLHYDVFTSGINYVSLYFDMHPLDDTLIPYASLMTKLVGAFPTKKYSVDELATLEDLHTGGMTLSTTVFTKSSKDTLFYPKFVVKAKAFDEQLNWVNELVFELLVNSQFNDKQKMKEQLLKVKSRHEAKISYDSHIVATHRVRSYYSIASKYEELLSGLDFYYFVRDLLEDFDNKFDEIVRQLRKVQSILFNQQQLTVGLIGKLNTTQSQWETIKQLVQQFDNTIQPPQTFNYTATPLNEGLIVAQDVQYVAQGYNYTFDNLAFNGRLKVLKNILSYTYLWQNIRVKGGAYGAFNVQTRDGDFIFCSYRDPNVKETLETYANCYEFVQSLNLDERELTKAIIGTFSELDRPLSPKDTGEVAFTRYFTNVSIDDIAKERHDVLTTTLTDLQQLAIYLSTTMSKNYYCVIGNKVTLDKNKPLFNSLKTVIK